MVRTEKKALGQSVSMRHRLVAGKNFPPQPLGTGTRLPNKGEGIVKDKKESNALNDSQDKSPNYRVLREKIK